MTQTCNVDGSSNDGGCGTSLVFSSPALEHLKIEYALRLGSKASNNEIEYEVILTSLRLAQVVEAKQLDIIPNQLSDK